MGEKRGVLQRVLDLIYPPKCPFCQTVLEGEELLCLRCQRTLPWLSGAAAERTAEFVTVCVSPLAYRGTAAESVKRYKFSGCRSYARCFGTLMAQCVEDHLPGRFDVICWAPLSRKRLRHRGYDQARLLASAMGERLGMEPSELLRKVRDTRAQSGLEGNGERRGNVLGVYELAPGACVAGKRVLVVDDVVTSGATLSECARALRTAGAADVVAVTLAQARGNG